MKRWLAVWLSLVLLMTSVSLVSADGIYNDDHFNWGEWACPHTQTEEVAKVPSTCITQGLSGYIRCADCKLLVSGAKEPLPLADHTYDNACDADCNVCGAWREVEAHDYHITVIAPDCENSGYTVYTCTACGYSYADHRVDATGHTYQVTEDTAPTCVAEGQTLYVCAACGDRYTEIVPATGKHIYDFVCDESCNVCGYVRSDAHVFSFMGTVEPTCGEDGSDGYKCWECGEMRYDIIPATGKHTYSGVCDVDCNVCGHTRDSVAAHSYDLTAFVELTCVTDGIKTYTCQNCGDSYTEVTAAEGHKYHMVITAPDCENGGYTTHTCTVCGDICVDNRVDATGHAYEAVVTPPTCGMDGYTTHTCANCGDSYTDSPTSATGEHTYDNSEDLECNGCDHIRHRPGDVDGNNRVNNRDLGLLQMFLNGNGELVDAAAADTDSNGRVNNRDLGILQRHLNGWDDVLV